MNFFREIEILLRNPRALVEEIREERALGDLCRRLFLATACFGAVYGACLLGRFAAGWGGARVVILQLCGYGLLLASMLTVGRVFGTFHRFAG